MQVKPVFSIFRFPPKDPRHYTNRGKKMAPKFPTCNRCERQAHEIEPDEEPCSLWKITWTTEGNPHEILCAHCLDIRDEFIAHETGHICNYEAPEGIFIGEPCPTLGCDNLATHEIPDLDPTFCGLCADCFQIHNNKQ